MNETGLKNASSEIERLLQTGEISQAEVDEAMKKARNQAHGT